MITCKLQGGLGNQLFQIFATISYAMKYNKSFFFLNIDKLGISITIRYTYWNSFLSELKPFLKNSDQIPQQLVTIKEQKFNYEPISENLYDGYGVVLNGYYQSYKYFQRYKDIIYKLLKIEFKKRVIMEREQIRSKLNFDKTISLHFRLGDYKFFPNKHPILPCNYYCNSISFILNDEYDFNEENKCKTVLYFCENNDMEDVEKTVTKLRIHFPQIHFQRANPTLSDWEQLMLMSVCKHNIIANSTFSWWGAYFNSNVSNIICYPERWFGPMLNHDTSDMFPEDWIKINYLDEIS
jgi:hypothetical protein